jgi:hypothetical protein
VQKVDAKKLSKTHALYLAHEICGAIAKGFKTLKQRVVAGESNDFMILGAGKSSRDLEYQIVLLEPFVWGITETTENVKRRYCFYLLQKNYLEFAKEKSLEDITALVYGSSVRAREFLGVCEIHTNIERTINRERRKLSSKRNKSVKARVWTKEKPEEKPKRVSRHKITFVLKRRQGFVSYLNIAGLIGENPREVKKMLEAMVCEGKLEKSPTPEHPYGGNYRWKA